MKSSGSASPAEVAIEIRNLRKDYTGSDGSTPAVAKLSFGVRYGEVVGLLGPNGSGKTTTIKAILGLVTHDSGIVLVDGEPIADRRHKLLTKCGVVLEGSRNLYLRLTPTENIYYFAGLRGISRRQSRSRAQALIENLGLSGKADAETGSLSRGYQQRVAVACALIHDPTIVLLDEPTLGLDYESSSKMIELIHRLSHENRAVLVSSHDMSFIEAVCHRVVVLKHGNAVADDSILGLKDKLASRTLIMEFPIRTGELLLSTFSDIPGFRTVSKEDSIEMIVPIKSIGDAVRLLASVEKYSESVLNISFLDNDFESAFVALMEQDQYLEEETI